MERQAWLKQMQDRTETLYDHLSPQYWVTYGFYENQAHQAFLQKFLEQIAPGGMVLSAGCGAGRYDGLLLDAGYAVVGIDQSAGMLVRAREHFPQARYEKMSLQEIRFQAAFDGVICIDALEHVCPEEYPGILCNFSQALKAGGMLYFTVDVSAQPEELAASYARALAQGLPVVYGEVIDETGVAYDTTMQTDQASGAVSDQAVYHYYPPLDEVRRWIGLEGLSIEEEGEGSGYYHFLAKK